MSGYLQPELVSVEKFFRSGLMLVPEYQRSYAWDQPQWDDLWSDVYEGFTNDTDHFLGTVVLRQAANRRNDSLGRKVDVFEIVDGQQRIVTLALLVMSLFDKMRGTPIGKGIWCDFVEDAAVPRLELGGVNADYLADLVVAVREGHASPDSSRATNRRIKNCLCFFREKLMAFSGIPGAPGPEDIAAYIRSRLQALRFVTNDASLAIKTFQTVNDRGRPLTLLDKTKSFLMFYVTKYLDSDPEIFHCIQDRFGKIYENFDKTMDLAKTHRIEYFTNPAYRFGENELLTLSYHFTARHLISSYGLSLTYAYDLSSERVFENFLKPALVGIRNNRDNLRHFVSDFVDDFALVTQSLYELVANIPVDPAYERLFCRQGVSASIYPLLIGAKAQQMLDCKMLDAIAILDLRVYKVRGTDPKASLYKDAVSELRCGASYENIYRRIIDFTRWYGSDSELDGYLRQAVYRKPYVHFVLWEMGAATSSGTNKPSAQLYSACQVDHILPQVPQIDVSTCGFATDDDYRSQINRFGNLCLLEATLNQGAGNVSLNVKSAYYTRSSLETSRVMGYRLAEKAFGRDNIDGRTEEVVKFFRAHWLIPVATGVPISNDIENETNTSTS